MLYPITEEALHQVFSPHGSVEKIIIFQTSADFQSLIQFEGRLNVILARIYLQGRNIYYDCCQLDIQFYDAGAAIKRSCAGENVIGMSLVIPQTPVFKSENSDADGGVVEVKRPNNRSSPPSDSTLTISNDMDEYHTILKNKIH
ncbi:hypothetical protein Goshw_015775 [Gossypium schwendimanii]|uniref:PTBP1-like RNA recognition motif 2 domain-containing protein n=1 Tax=Gossypium schwendimanii TaxID=34291 RepID=A0A7J9L3A5_GOSSC|nr:hypothetical protein [Gossypium schwendimanii]